MSLNRNAKQLHLHLSEIHCKFSWVFFVLLLVQGNCMCSYDKHVYATDTVARDQFGKLLEYFKTILLSSFAQIHLKCKGNQKGCYSYRIHPILSGIKVDFIIINFKSHCQYFILNPRCSHKAKITRISVISSPNYFLIFVLHF